MSIAGEIARQLSGALYVIGAKNLVSFRNGLAFRIMRNCKNVSYVKIELNGLDLYNVSYLNIRAGIIKTIAISENIYCDMLKSDITRNTGLNTVL